MSSSDTQRHVIPYRTVSCHVTQLALELVFIHFTASIPVHVLVTLSIVIHQVNI